MHLTGVVLNTKVLSNFEESVQNKRETNSLLCQLMDVGNSEQPSCLRILGL